MAFSSILFKHALQFCHLSQSSLKLGGFQLAVGYVLKKRKKKKSDIDSNDTVPLCCYHCSCGVNIPVYFPKITLYSLLYLSLDICPWCELYFHPVDLLQFHANVWNT